MPPVVVVSGSNYQMGYQYGEKVGHLIFHNWAILKSKLVKAYGKEGATKDIQVWSYYLWKYDPDLKDWLRGIRDGCEAKGYGISVLDLVSIGLYPTEIWGRPDTPYPKETGVEGDIQSSAYLARTKGYHSCTSFSATGSATRDGKPLVAITKMVPAETMQSFILIAFPDEGPSFITSPIAGTVAANAGLNKSGFASADTAIFGPLAWNYPIEGYFHYLPQHCKSQAEAHQFLKSTPRGGLMGTVNMADAAGNISLFEGNAKEFAIRKPGECGETAPFLVQTNHHINPALLAYNKPWKTEWDWNIDSYYRYATAFERVKAAAEKGEIDFEFVKRLQRSDDWYDPDTKTWHYNEPESGFTPNNFPESVSQLVLFPADLIAYIEVGTPSGIGLPAEATGEYVKFQLADDPATVATKADEDAFVFYKTARDLFQKELNRKAPNLTYAVSKSIKRMLDKAISEYECGMDRAGFAYLAGVDGSQINEQLTLWSEALTHFSKTQLFSQMVTTELKNLAK